MLTVLVNLLCRCHSFIDLHRLPRTVDGQEDKPEIARNPQDLVIVPKTVAIIGHSIIHKLQVEIDNS